jgi:hypothetical protein
MRTTVTLDPDVAERLKAWAHRQQLSFKEAINTLIRRGLSSPGSGGRVAGRFIVRPHRSAFRPGLDPGKLGQLVDQLEVEDFARERPTSR